MHLISTTLLHEHFFDRYNVENVGLMLDQRRRFNIEPTLDQESC